MKKKNILLAEDDALIGQAYEEGLHIAGYNVIRATNGQEVVDKLEGKMPDLLLLDLRMPKKDGFQVLEEMNKKGWIKKVNVIVTSNLSQNEDVERCKAQGAKEYLIKSNTSFSDLIKMVKKYIKK